MVRAFTAGLHTLMGSLFVATGLVVLFFGRINALWESGFYQASEGADGTAQALVGALLITLGAVECAVSWAYFRRYERASAWVVMLSLMVVMVVPPPMQLLVALGGVGALVDVIQQGASRLADALDEHSDDEGDG